MADENIRRVIASPETKEIVRLSEDRLREPFSNEAVIRVRAFSLNRGELRRAQNATSDHQSIGWDIAGDVVTPAADGSGPGRGTRVVGFSTQMEGWAELVCLPTSYICPVLDGVSDAQAATLPVAGLTALHAVDAATSLLGSKALVTGTTGGVGMFAVQLAALAGAEVYAQIRHPEQRAFVASLGHGTPLVSAAGAEIAASGPFRLIVDGVSGTILEGAIDALAPEGVCVCYGVTASPDITINVSRFMRSGLGRIMGFHLYNKSETAAPRDHLHRLLTLVRDNRLNCLITREASWTDVNSVARDLIDRKFLGKAVLHVD